MNIVVLSIDRLHAGYLGCYGNAWVATPHFNHLTAESIVFDQAIIDHPRLENLFNTWWLGRHALEQSACEPPTTLAERLAAAGFATCLITDEPRVASHSLAGHFAELLMIEAAAERSAERHAGGASETRAASLFAAATERLASAKPPFFFWIHSCGMEATWDAPDDFRQQYAEPDEPEPPRLATVPCHRLVGDEDPDEIWGVCQAYAGQVSLIDACLGGLLEALESQPFRDQTLLVVAGLRGFPLGRNGRIGSPDDALYSELLQIPWLMRLPGVEGAARSQALVQPCDLVPTLAEHLNLAGSRQAIYARSLLPILREELETVRDRIPIVGSDGERAIRTPAWHLRLARAAEGGGKSAELYAKPDDRWDQNDVADRCPEVAEGLVEAIGALESSIAAGTIDSLSPLSDALAR